MSQGLCTGYSYIWSLLFSAAVPLCQSNQFMLFSFLYSIYQHLELFLFYCLFLQNTGSTGIGVCGPRSVPGLSA